MIYTVTINPSIDYIMETEHIEVNKVTRCKDEHITCGGKGLNVSIVLNNLGVDNVALGFVAGFTGDKIEQLAKDKGVGAAFIKLKNGMSRINVKIKNCAKKLQEETVKGDIELNGQGPNATLEEIGILYRQLDRMENEDVIVFGGSIPESMPKDLYERLIKRLGRKKVYVVIDATKKTLENALKYKPFLIKPNKDELEEIFNVECSNNDDIILYAKKLREKGARNVLVSLGEEGAILLTEADEIYEAKAPKGKVKSAVGAGDSMVAGFIAKYMESNNFEEALKYGVAAGSATAFTTDLATKDSIDKLYKKM